MPPINTYGNEFFILIDPDYSFAFEETEISPTPVFSADTAEGPFTLTNATNANPIAVTTSAPHGLLTGRVVLIEGVLGNLAANGVWPTIVTGASTFTIPVIGSGGYTSGGTITVANDAVGHSISLGEVIIEHDALAINGNVVQNGSGGSGGTRVSFAY